MRFLLSLPTFLALAAIACAPAVAQPAAAGGAASDLAQQLSNPVASLISIPIQNNFDWGLRLNVTFLFPK